MFFEKYSDFVQNLNNNDYFRCKMPVCDLAIQLVATFLLSLS